MQVVRGKTFTLSTPQAVLVFGEDVNERTRRAITHEIATCITEVNHVSRDGCEVNIFTKHGDQLGLWASALKKIEKIVRTRCKQQR